MCQADNGVDIPAVATFIVEISRNFFKFSFDEFILKLMNNLFLKLLLKQDAPEIVVEHSWVHTGLGSLTELACTVHAHPAAQVYISY